MVPKFKQYINENVLPYTGVFFPKSSLKLEKEVRESIKGDLGSFDGRVAADEVHMTWKFPRGEGEGNYPPRIKAGDKAKVTVVGYYADDELVCLVCKLGGKETQPDSKTPLHITLFTKRGVKPVESGRRANNKTILLPSYEIVGTWK